MPIILAAIFAGSVMFGSGQVSVDKPQVVLMKDGAVVGSSAIPSPILVVVNNHDVEIRGAKQKTSISLHQPKGLYRDVYGNWDTSCGEDCK